MKLKLDAKVLLHGLGLEIQVDGFPGDAAKDPTQVYVEIYDGRLQIHIFDNPESGEPVYSHKIAARRDHEL